MDTTMTMTKQEEICWYLVRWQGRPLIDCTWINEPKLRRLCEDLYQKTMEAYLSGIEFSKSRRKLMCIKDWSVTCQYMVGTAQCRVVSCRCADTLHASVLQSAHACVACQHPTGIVRHDNVPWVSVATPILDVHQCVFWQFLILDVPNCYFISPIMLCFFLAFR